MLSGDQTPSTERTTPLSVVAAAVAAGSCAAVALGAPVALLALPLLAAVVLAWTAIDASRRIRRLDRQLAGRERDIATLELDLATEAEGRRAAESRLAWRTRLASLRRARRGETLLDPESGLLLEFWLPTAVHSRIASGRRRLTPVAVAMLEVVEDLECDPPQAFDAGRASELLQATIREADTAFRLDEGGFAVLLEDTDDFGALRVIKRFGEAISVLSPRAVVRAGVACYPAHGLQHAAVLDRADEALEQARRWRQHRIEVAPAEH